MFPKRPLLRWHGGKWRLGPWIISHFPWHRTYVEPFGGAASVLLRKPRAWAEVYNDLDEEVVNLFVVMRDPVAAEQLRRAVELTAFSRAEFELAYEPDADCAVERARRLVVRSFMGFGSNSHATQRGGRRSTGFRACVSRSRTSPATDWRGYPEILPAIVERLRGVVIERRPALQVIAGHDAPDTLFYVDPPYLHETRSAIRCNSERGLIYAHEMTDEEHVELLEVLQRAAGMVIISGYDHPLYQDSLASWRRVVTDARADGGKARTEVLWINPACSAAHDKAAAPLWAGMEGAA